MGNSQVSNFIGFFKKGNLNNYYRKTNVIQTINTLES